MHLEKSLKTYVCQIDKVFLIQLIYSYNSAQHDKLFLPANPTKLITELYGHGRQTAARKPHEGLWPLEFLAKASLGVP